MDHSREEPEYGECIDDPSTVSTESQDIMDEPMNAEIVDEEIASIQRETLQIYEEALEHDLITNETIMANIADALGIRLDDRKRSGSMLEFFKGFSGAFADKGEDIGAILAAIYVHPERTMAFILERWKSVLTDPLFLIGQVKQSVSGTFQSLLHQNGKEAPYQIGYAVGTLLTFYPALVTGQFLWSGGTLTQAGRVGTGITAAGATSYTALVTAPALSATVAPELRTPARMQEEVARSLDNFFYNHPNISPEVEMRTRMCMGIISSTLYNLSTEEKERFFSLYSKLFAIRKVLEGSTTLLQGEGNTLSAGLDMAMGGSDLVTDPLTQEEIIFLSQITIDAIYNLKNYDFSDAQIYQVMEIFGLKLDALQGDFLNNGTLSTLMDDPRLLNTIPGLREFSRFMDGLDVLETFYDPERDEIDTEVFRNILVDKLVGTIGFIKTADEVVTNYCNQEFERRGIKGRMPREEFSARMMEFRLPDIQIKGYESLEAFMNEANQNPTRPDPSFELYASDVSYQAFLNGQDNELIRFAQENKFPVDTYRSSGLRLLSVGTIAVNILQLKALLKNINKDLSRSDALDFFVSKGFMTKETFDRYDFVAPGLKYTRSILQVMYMRYARDKSEAMNDVVKTKTPKSAQERIMKLDIEDNDEDYFLSCFAYIQNGVLPGHDRLYYLSEYYLSRLSFWK